MRNGRLIEKTPHRTRAHLITPDIDPFISHVDGSVVGSRQAREEHNKRNNVVPMGEMDADIAAKTREREDFYSGKPHDTQRRLDAIRFATDLETANRTPADKAQMIENYRERN